MRSAVIVLAAWCAVMPGCGTGHQAALPQTVPEGYDVASFDMLNGYGEWVDLPARGRVWRPNVSYDWAPFTQGHWIWTRNGWTWMGDEPFSWVVYHYGDWDYQPGMGWVWVPGYEWSPARVVWYTGDEYVGWAPLPPPDVVLPAPGERVPMSRWSIVPMEQFTRSDVGRYRMEDNLGSVHWPRQGRDQPPDVAGIERRTGQRIPLVQMQTERVRSGNREFLRTREAGADLRSTTPPPPGLPPPPQAPTNLPIGTERGNTNRGGGNPPATGTDRNRQQPARQRNPQRPAGGSGGVKQQPPPQHLPPGQAPDSTRSKSNRGRAGDRR